MNHGCWCYWYGSAICAGCRCRSCKHERYKGHNGSNCDSYICPALICPCTHLTGWLRLECCQTRANQIDTGHDRKDKKEQASHTCPLVIAHLFPMDPPFKRREAFPISDGNTGYNAEK